MSSSSKASSFIPTPILSCLPSTCKSLHLDSVQALKFACHVASAMPSMPFFESLKAKIKRRIDPAPISDDILAKLLITYPVQTVLCSEEDLVQLYKRTALCPGASTQLRLRTEYGIALNGDFQVDKVK